MNVTAHRHTHDLPTAGAPSSAATLVLGHTRAGAPVTLDPLKAVGKHVFVAAATGAGKSYTLRRYIELLMAAGYALVIVDVEGEFHTLKEVAHDRVLILGGKHAQVPLELEVLNTMVAPAIRGRCVMIVDVSDLDDSDQCAAVSALKAGLWAVQESERVPVAFVVDEVQRFAPQVGQPSSRKSLETVARQGRKRHIALVSATQRISDVAKSVVTQASHVLIGRTTFGADRKRIAKEIDLPRDLLAELEKLDSGDFVVKGEAFGGGPIVMRTSRTLSDHGSTLDLEACLQGHRANAADVAETLRRSIASGRKGDPVVASAVPNSRTKSGETRVASTGTASDDRSAARIAQTRAKETMDQAGPVDWDFAVSLLEALAGAPRGRVTQEELALLVGHSPAAARFRGAIGVLIARGLITYGKGGSILLTRDGRENLPDGATEATSCSERIAAMRAALPSEEARILDILLASSPDFLDKPEIAARTRMSPRSRKLTAALKALSRARLIRKYGDLFQASSALARLVSR